MNNTLKTKLIKYLIPKFSEFEFIFFISLVISVSIVGLAKNFSDLQERLMDFSDSPINLLYVIAGAVAVLIFYGALISMALKAYRLKAAFWNLDINLSYILLPTYILLIAGAAGLIWPFLVNQSSFDGVDFLAGVILARMVILLFIMNTARYTSSVKLIVASNFSPYQTDRSDLLIALTLGIIGSTLISLTDNWLLLLVIVNSIGRIMITKFRYYKTNRY